MRKDDILEMLDEARFLKNEIGDSKGAIKECNKILKIEPENRDAMLIKAGALSELGRVEEFVELVNKIIKKWPEHWEAYYLLSMFCFMMKEDDKALELMHHSIKLDENFNNVMSYAHILYLTGNQDYMKYVDNAKKMDKERAENFLKNIWIWDSENLKPALSGTLKAFKAAEEWKRIKKKEKFDLEFK
ncbi:hypothetical protein HYT26_03230 [Candidatus Pacearchaeota archaeon]|nr:hypothetical protein [Candidatus Pacearchaeota archaeon]